MFASGSFFLFLTIKNNKDMKTKQYYLSRIVIFTAVLALMATYYIGYTRGKAAPVNAPVSTSVEQARGYFKKYLNTSPLEFNGTVKALVVDMEQYQAMKEILENTSGTEGFRIYYGIDDNNQFVRMVVGISAEGRDKVDYIRTTSTMRSGLCPPICDSPNGVLGE